MTIENLIESLQTDILNDHIPLVNLVRKAQVIARKLNLTMLEDWTINELDGYPDHSSTPDYRQVPAALVASFGNGVMRVTGKHVSTSLLPEPVRDRYRSYKFKDGISTLLNFSTIGEKELHISLPDVTASFYHNKVYEGYACEEIVQVVSLPYIVQILDAIRDRLLRFVLDIEEEVISIEEESREVVTARLNFLLSNQTQSSSSIKKLPTIFLCHSSLDKQFATHLSESLESHSISTWLDKKDLIVGQDWIDEIQDAVSRATYVVVIQSESLAKHGPWAKEEFKLAFQRQVTENRTVILPVIIDESSPIPLLGSRHFADFRGSFEFGLQQLIRAIKHFNGDRADEIANN